MLDCVDKWIAPSGFMRDKFTEAGIDPKKIFTLPHCWDAGSAEPDFDEGGHYLFLGRLVAEKGIMNLVDAWKTLELKLGDACPNLLIAGTGPEEDRLNELCAKLKRVSCVGFVDGERKTQLLRQCRALLVPSIWWEPLGLTAYEAYAAGRPVIGSNAGALQETVTDGVTGWSYQAGDAADLASVIQAAEFSGASERARRGKAGRDWLRENADPEKWRQRFLSVCKDVIADYSLWGAQ